VGPCHHGMALHRVAYGGDGLQIWKMAADILNKQLRTEDKGWSSSFGLGRESNEQLLTEKKSLLRNVIQDL
jgi:hypothetical protein